MMTLIIAAAAAAHYLEPYKRALIGFMGGVTLVLAILSVLGMDQLISSFSVMVLAAIGGVLGATIALKYFDFFIVAASAFGGAALIVTGAQLLLPTSAEPSGTILPALLTVILGIFGLRWQISNIASWVPPQPDAAAPFADRAGKQAGMRNP